MASLIDTNILIRYVTNDDPIKAEKARRLFERVEAGELEILVCEAVLSEVVWVLTHPKVYNLSREEVAGFLSSFIRLSGVLIQGKSTYLRALEMYKTTDLDFPDCILASMVESGKSDELISFDRHIAEYFDISINQLN